MELLKDNYQRNRTLTMVVVACAVAVFVQIIATINNLSVMNDIVGGVGVMDILSRYEASENFYDITGFIEIIVSVILAVVMILWMRRAYYNLSIHPMTYTEHPEGWAAGAWFVPFVNLVRPYQIVREIWEKTQQLANIESLRASSAIIGYWWAGYIGRVVLNQVSIRMLRNSGMDFEMVLNSYYVNLAANIAGLISLYFLYKIVVAMRKYETEMYNNQGGDMDDLSRHLTGESNLV